MPSQEQDHSTCSQPVGAGNQHDTDFLHGLLRPVHESWHGLLLDALRRVDGNFLRSLNTHRDLNGARLTVTLPSGFTFASGVSASSFALVVGPNGAFSQPPRRAMG